MELAGRPTFLTEKHSPMGQATVEKDWGPHHWRAQSTTALSDGLKRSQTRLRLTPEYTKRLVYDPSDQTGLHAVTGWLTSLGLPRTFPALLPKVPHLEYPIVPISHPTL